MARISRRDVDHTKMTTTPDTTDDALAVVAEQIDIDVEGIKNSVERVLSEPLYWFPVRHHSPTVARHLQDTIQKRKPKMLFIEGPAEANELITHIVDSATRPPVAIYSSYRDDDNVLGLAGIASAAPDIPARFASWYPMLSYSPEYVALVVAKKLGVAVTFMDLPHRALIKPAQHVDKIFALLKDEFTAGQDAEQENESEDEDQDKSESKSENEKENENDSEKAKAEEDEKRKELVDPKTGSEKLIVESGFYQRLADVAGYRTFNEAWDSLFEIRDFKDDLEFFRREVATFCAASRATSDRVETAIDGTLERERFMMKTIRETMQTHNLKPADCMVICGGFHLFLDSTDETPPPSCPEGTVYTTVVPYSFYRFSELSGYGAGNRAPQYYQTLWDLRNQNREKDILIEHVVTTLKQARKEGEPLSSADAISTCQHAEMLARLRGRPMPILDDIHDALITCCCKGDPGDVGVHLIKAITNADIGTKIGRVTDALGQLPIVNDFYRQMDILQLNECMSKEQLLKLKIDKRKDLENKQSIFFHRLSWLDVGLASLLEAPSGDFSTGTLFLERWGVKWSPNVESKLIDCNLYGDTIESAALAHFRELMAMEELNAGKASKLLVDAIHMNLPNVIQEVEGVLASAIDNDNRFASLAEALANLVVLERYGIYRDSRKGIVDVLLERCFDRACFAVIEIIAVPEDQQPGVVSGLLTVAELVQRGDRANLDKTLFVEHVRNAADACEVPFMRGVLLGVLTEMRINTADDLAKELSALAKAPVQIMITAGDFLDGIMAASRTSIMLGAKSLIAAIDELLRAAEWDPFLTMVPKMRAAFERLHGSQLDNVADTVAKQYGLKDSDSLTELHTTVEAAAMIVEIDNRVAQIMSKWDF
ncbi:MAG: hypothetical protein JST89_10985 [Cyanobacteria bacterium SZAS-4]|nr:hypothetical protein [Cyanobacteria bacterium SZAS-4]